MVLIALPTLRIIVCQEKFPEVTFGERTHDPAGAMQNGTLTDLLMLLASAQGLFLGVLILHKYGSLLANRFLAGLLFLHAGLLLHMSLQNINRHDSHPKLVFLIIGLSFLVGPLHYLYSKFLAHPGAVPQKRELLHGIPFVVFEALVLIFFHPATASDSLGESHQEAWLHDFGFFHFVLIIHLAAYLIQTQRILRKYGQRMLEVFSTVEKIKLTWLRDITWLFIIITVIYSVEFGLLLLGIG